jgi:hypothetical protein
MSNTTETYTIRLNDVNFMAGMRRAQEEAGQTTRRVSGIGGAMRMVGGIMAGFSIYQLGSSVVDTLSKFEKFEAVLTNTFGDNSTAKKSLAEITQFAKETPFQVDELANAYVKLANRGIAPTMDEMRKMGDVASSTGKGFDQLAEAVLDASTGEFERLKEYGITAKKSGDKVAFSFKGVTTQVGFSDKAIVNYIQGLGNMNGVLGASDAIMGTTGGRISNLGDSLTALYLVIGQNLAPAIAGTISALQTAISSISGFVTFITSGTTGAKAFAVGVAVLGGALLAYGVITGAAAIKTAVLAASQWLLNTAMTANPIGVVVVALGALVAGIVVAYNQFDTFRAVVDGAWSSIQVMASNIKTTFLNIPELIIKAFTQIPTALMSAFSGVGKIISALLSGDLKAIPSLMADLGKDILKGNPLTGFAVNMAESVTKGSGAAFTNAYDNTMTQAEKDKAAKGKAAGSKLDVPAAGTGAGAKAKGVDAGISEVRSSAPKNFYISIGNLVKDLNINTTNLSAGSAKLKEEITKVLLTAVNDMQIISQ